MTKRISRINPSDAAKSRAAGNIVLRFGAMAPPIEDQLRQHGLTSATKMRITMRQRQADAVTLLGVSEVLTSAEVRKARARLMKQTLDDAMPIRVQRLLAQTQTEEGPPPA